MRDDEFIALAMKSTIDRFNEPRLMPLARLAGRALSRTAPRLAARLAARLFLSPPRHPAPAAERAALAAARPGAVALDGGTLPTWTWGAGPPVLLVHGWGGRGGQLAAFAGPLVARGFSVVAFDAPGHGKNPRRRAVTLPELTAAIRAVAAAHAPVHGVIAHSLGAVATARALYEGLGAAAVVFVAPPAELVTPAEIFTSALGLSPRVRDLLREGIEREIGLPWSAFDVRRLAPSLPVPLLVFHDRGDAEIPWQQGRAIVQVWPGARLVTTDALGHRRILRDREITADAATFVAAGPEGRRRTEAPGHRPAQRPVGIPG
jgi:pimeloyl-ACP methyl ester carboxylesterase